MQRAWLEPDRSEIPAKLRVAVGGHELVTRGLINRGISDVDVALRFLDPRRYTPTAARELPGIDRAATRILEAIRAHEPICVWGDFDADGLTATALLVSALRGIGGAVVFYVPSRQTESHGLNVPGLERLLQNGVHLVVTCDTGVRDHEAAQYLKNQGVDLIVTDHHDLPDDLPDAYAVVNPKLLDKDHALAHLPGVGCAYQLVRELLGVVEKPDEISSMLDLVAIGTVADLAILRRDVRYIVQLGLEELRRTRRPGLEALMAMAEIERESVNEDTVSFALAPRLNALGRLGDANQAVELLLTADPELALQLSRQVEALNARRRLLTDQVLQAAESQLERTPGMLSSPALILEHDAWPEGVIGLVAARLAERYGRPAVVIAIGTDGLARGSARSVAGVDISTAIQESSESLERFGGHPMAAGFSLQADRIPEFKRTLATRLQQQHPRAPAVIIDGEVGLHELILELGRELERLGPFGPGNPPITLVTRGLSLKGVRGLGKREEHLEVTVKDRAGESRRVYWWAAARAELPEGSFDLAYRPRLRTYRGEVQLQLEWIDFRPSERESVQLPLQPATLQVVDLRQAKDPLASLKELNGSELQVWSEDSENEDVPLRTRDELKRRQHLAIWSIPPGTAELQEAMRRVRPDTVYLFGNRSPHASPQGFLERLAGLVKFAMANKDGRLDLTRLAGILGHRRQTVEAGLEVLVSLGQVTTERQADDQIWVRKGSGRRQPQSSSAALLTELLRETAAYRQFFLTAEVEALRRSFTLHQ